MIMKNALLGYTAISENSKNELDFKSENSLASCLLNPYLIIAYASLANQKELS